MKIKRQLFIFSFVLISLVAGLNKMALNFFLYWRFWWFDIMMHFLGGLWIGSIVLWFYYFSGYIKNPIKTKKYIFWISVISVVIVGLGWEVFEFLIDANLREGYFGDTILDLIMDIIGAIVAYWIIIKTSRKEKIEEEFKDKKIE